MSLDLEESDELSTLQATLEGEIFDCSLRVKKLLLASTHKSGSPTSSSDGKGVKLPKLDVPMFDGNILHWRSFWEQFCVSIHDRSNLSDTEKLVYLQQSLKNGSAKSTIEGLSRSGEYYAEAVECLKSRYDRPRLIHLHRGRAQSPTFPCSLFFSLCSTRGSNSDRTVTTLCY